MKNTSTTASFILAVAATAWAWTAGAQTAPNPAPETAPRMVETGEVFDEVVTALDKHGLHVDVEKAQRAAIDAVVRFADPGGRVVVKSDIDLMDRGAERQHLCYWRGPNHDQRVSAR